MRHAIAAMFGLAAALSAGSACALSGKPVDLVDCAVIGGEKLPVATGGPAGICAVIAKAISVEAPSVPVKVRVQVKSNSRLTAMIERDGVELPARNFSISDSQLRKSSIEEFARAIAGAVKGAG